ncbi:MAG: trigger factor [Pseudomonadota bacterium]
MEVTEVSAEGLERKFNVKVPAAELQEKLDAKLEGIKGQVHLKGFRKGKAPLSYLKKMYGKGVMGEIVQEIVAEQTQKAFSDRDLKPAGDPLPHFNTDLEAVVAGEADLDLDVQGEILPTFETMDLAGVELTRPVADVPDEDIDKALNEIAERQKSFEPKAEGEAAADGDQVVIDFLGKIDGEPFEGGAGEGAELVIGSGSFIPGFEEQLVGAKAGDERTLTVTFPEEYGASHLAGKDATFDVTVNAVKAAAPVEINDALAEQLGLESADDLRKRVVERLEAEFAQRSRTHLKRALLDKLDDGHDFALPAGMVDQEFGLIWNQVENAERDEEDKGKSEDEMKAEYRKIAERRVRLGLVLAEIGKDADVQVPNAELQQAVQEAAVREAYMMNARGQQVSPKDVLGYFQQNPAAIAQIRAPLFEEKVVDYIIERAKVEDKPVSKDELMKDPDGEI